ncbi:MAG TPA: phospholipid carrier-dependent glycosyltransferase [Actinomycetota bacterium]|nr:phospholipid carrier-dependent glycosyltransferase [Actinomycetota bacterium]
MRSLLRLIDRPAVALVAVALIAGIPRSWDLGSPRARVFDEVYYSKAGCLFVGYPPRTCGIETEDERYWVRTKGDVGSWVHPPLGKWAIGLGELAFGVDAFGWRVSAAVAGTLTAVLTAAAALLLFGSGRWAFVAGLLLATENLSFVQSRTAMLDVFVALWTALAFVLLLLDRRWILRRTPLAEDLPPGASRGPTAAVAAAPARAIRVPSPLLRPWRLATGLALGAAVATKWSGLTAILGVGLLSALWEVERRRRAGVRRAWWRALQQEGFPLVVSFLLLPAAVYVASYAGWFARFGFDLGAWARLQDEMASYHLHLQVTDASGRPIHPYLSEAWKWILDWRPVLYFARYPTEGVRRVIYAMGNPAVFWGSLLAIPYALSAWARRRDWRAGFVALSALALYLPWFAVSRPQFLFYMTPIVPSLVLALTYGLRDLAAARLAGSRAHPWLPLAVGFVALSVGLFAFFWPVLTARPIGQEAWELRSWFPTWV